MAARPLVWRSFCKGKDTKSVYVSHAFRTIMTYHCVRSAEYVE